MAVIHFAGLRAYHVLIVRSGSQPKLSVKAEDSLKRAVTLYLKQDLKGAQELCRSVLSIRPGTFEALSLLGMIEARYGRAAEAESLLSSAVAVRPTDSGAVHNYARVLLQLGRPQQAIAAYERARSLQPRDVRILLDYAQLLRHLGRLEDARARYEQARQLAPHSPEVHHGCGSVLHGLKRHAEAIASYDLAIRLKGAYPEASNDKGVALQALDRAAEAVASFDAALRSNPGYAPAHFNRSNALRDLGHSREALEGYRCAIAAQRSYPEAHNNMGLLLHELGRFAEAVECYEQAVTLRPAYAESLYNRGNSLMRLGRSAEAVQSFERSLAANPTRAEAHAALGNVLLQRREFVSAAASFEQALRLDPGHPWVFGTWLFARVLSCEWSGLDAHLSTLAAMLLAGKDGVTPFVVTALMDSPELQMRAARNWARRMPPQQPEFARPSGRERIRIGYFSADFHNHPVAALTVGMFEHHERQRFEIIAMSYGPEKSDDMRVRLRSAFDRFIDVRELSDVDIARTSRELGIDIAVDLQGFTENQRPAIFANRAAPVQAGYLGYPGTMGADFMDYLIADRVLIPEGKRAHYSEKIVYLPHSYQANDRRRSIAEREFSRLELGLPERGFVYCCFNNTYKIVPQTFDVWMRILRRVPASVLWYAPSGDTADSNLRREAQARGVDPERLIRAGRLPLLSEHLARHRAADLFLDTLPFNAHTTASDALWAGLPVLTRMGESLAGRVAASLLRTLGLEELITSTEADYEEQAVALASDPVRLAQIRQKLAAARLSAPLFDTERFTRGVERAYLLMFDRWCRGLAPEDIVVAA